ncbi:hypothetical protein [Phenylobacterium sp.]|uniref:hypothetical protein n=1 Tax=Phenylobacterium sp. TaxID=1871053 RepID=UPI00301D3574
MPRGIGAYSPALRGQVRADPAPRPRDRGLDPRRRADRARRYDIYAPGAFDFEAQASGWHVVYVFGPGGYGGLSFGTAASDGGGGAAARWRLWLDRGDRLTGLVTAHTAATTVTFAGRTVSAGPGQTGGAGYTPGGSGGSAAGGDLNRTGGQGAGSLDLDDDPDTPDGPATGSYGEGGLAVVGGGAGFLDEIPDRTAGRGGFGWAGAPVGIDQRAPEPGGVVITGPH